MQHVSIEAVETSPSDGGADRRRLSDPLNAAAVAINHYELGPGKRLAGLHAHTDQEEVFVVSEGTATFETWTPAGGSARPREEAVTDGLTTGGGTGENGTGDEVTVRAGEAIRFAPGEFQSGTNDADNETTAVLAFGAPREGGAVRVPLACPDCGHASRRPDASDGETPVLVCPNCDGERDATCPECRSKAMTAVLADDRTAVIGVCRDCGAKVWA